MAAPYNNIRSKLNRAICSFLIQQKCGSIDDVLPANTVQGKTFLNTTVQCTLAQPDPPLSGDYRITVHISIKGSATSPVGEPNPAIQRVNFDQRISKTWDALMQSANGQDLDYTAQQISAAGRTLAVDASNGQDPVQKQLAANNADMVDFTCIQWIDRGTGDGRANEEGVSWEEILIFEALACSSNVD